MKTKIFLSFMMMLSLISCKFYVMYKDTAEAGYLCGKGDDRLVTMYEKDSKDYEIYVRYNQFEDVNSKNLNNCESNLDSKMYRTEIQYIIINTRNNNILYVSTTPSRYLKNKDENTYLMGDKGNSYFFNSYFIGKKVGDTMMIFRSSKDKMTWKFKKTNNALDINTIIGHKIKGNKDIHSSTRLVSEVLGNDFRFVKLINFKGFTYVHQNSVDDAAKVKEAKDHIALTRIRYIACGNKVTKVLLNYNTTIDENNKYKNIFYKQGRIRYIGDEDISYFSNLQKNKKK